MEKTITNEATCDNCARVYQATAKRYYCSHCNKYYYICTVCAESEPKCRFCGVPLKRRSEPQFPLTSRKRAYQRI